MNGFFTKKSKIEKKFSKMTSEEILLDMLEFYTNDPTQRCVDEGGGCYYSDVFVCHKSEGCAIGRMLDPELSKRLDNLYNTSSIKSIISLHSDLLPKWLLEHDEGFLTYVQTLHDNSRNWTSFGLSEEGKSFVRKIIFECDFNVETFKEFINED